MKYFTLILTVILLMMTSMVAKAQDISYENCVDASLGRKGL